jgi:hypothetical protein
MRWREIPPGGLDQTLRGSKPARPRNNELGAEEVRPYLRTAVLNIWRNRLRRLDLEGQARHSPFPRQELTFEDRDELWAAIRRLPARRRACLVLRYYEELSEAETADLLGCSIGTTLRGASRVDVGRTGRLVGGGLPASRELQAGARSCSPFTTVVSHDGYGLGRWLANQRTALRTGMLSEDRIRRLEELDIRTLASGRMRT